MENNKAARHEVNLGLPDNLDYKIIVGYEGSQSVDVIIFDTKRFEETGCEYTSEVFRATLVNLSGTTKLVVVEGSVETTHKVYGGSS